MNGSNEECMKDSNSCLSQLEKVNNYYYQGNNVNDGGGNKLAVTDRIGLG